ncbi:TonB-linked SusC/RagA family outer membrane protein [Pedobacter africanus]
MYYNSTRFASRCVPVFYTPFNIKKLKFFMKVNAILLMIILFAVSSINASPGSAQTLSDVKVSVGMDKGTLRTAFSQIEKQTDFRFAYRNELISVFKNLSIKGELRSVKNTLDELLKGTGLSYKQLNNSIIVFKESAPAQNQVSSRDIYINGRVTDENNLPLPGVSVKIKGTNKGVVTDNEGKYIIQVPNESAILVFSYIGYLTAEGTVQNGRMTNIRLKPDVGSLDAVVVIGYGTTTKRANTGSVTSITSKTIGAQPVNDPLSALQGRVAGLEISAVTGYPGSGYNVRLRGQNSIGAGNDPLYIVDGVPFISESLSQFTGANGNQSPLSSINPADIERIDILKDADATAIYGSRAANGVILITTKSGKAGKPEISFNAYTGLSRVNNPVKMLSTADYLELRREAFKNDGANPTADNAPDLMVWDQNVDQNWQKRLIGNSAALTEISTSIRGGTEQTNFMLGGTFRNEKTVLPGNTGLMKGALNMSVTHKSADDRFRVASSVKYVADQNNSLAADLTSFFNLAPNYPIYDANGAFYWYSNDQNPIAYLERKSLSNTQNILGDLNVSYRVTDGLSLRVTGGFNRMTMNQVQTSPKVSFNPLNYPGSMAIYGNSYLNSFIVEPQAEYTMTLGTGKFTALAGGTWQHTLREGNSVTGNGYVSDAQLENIAAAVSLTPRTYSYRKYRYTSVFGRLTYNLNEKYIVNGTFRRDGSSRFGPEKRFGNFGAVGAAWLFSNEGFLKKYSNVLSFGKLRASYGLVGNDQIGDYGYLDSWSATRYPYGGSGGLTPSRFANPLYSWEENRKLEFGLDLGFLKDRILLTTNFYRNRSDNQLIEYALSPQSGFDSYTANLPALVENKGLEFELSTVNIRNTDFSWTSALNLTFSKNKLLKYPNLENTSYADDYVLGQPLTIVKGFGFKGLDAQTGVPTFIDLDGDGAISDSKDMIVMGHTAPDFFGGLQNSFTYKNLSLDFFFQFVKQEGPGLNYGFLSYSNGERVNKDLSALDRWRNPGDPAVIPGASLTSGKPIYNAYRNNYRLSDANWVDASFIRLKNVSLRYNFGSLLKRQNLKNLTVYVQGQNLFTLTKYDGFDPETKAYVLPPLSTYTAGVQVSF